MININQNGEKIGYLPYGYGTRLGAARYDKSYLSNVAKSQQISVDRGAPLWPELQTIFDPEIKYNLPRKTNPSRYNNEGYDVNWSIQIGEEKIQSTEQFQILTPQAEGKKFLIIGQLDTGETQHYRCSTRYRPAKMFQSCSLDYGWGEDDSIKLDFNAKLLVNYEEIEFLELQIGDKTVEINDGLLIKENIQFAIKPGVKFSISIPFGLLCKQIESTAPINVRCALRKNNKIEVYGKEYYLEESEFLSPLDLKNDHFKVFLNFNRKSIPFDEIYSPDDESEEVTRIEIKQQIPEVLRNKVNFRINYPIGLEDSTYEKLVELNGKSLNKKSIKKMFNKTKSFKLKFEIIPMIGDYLFQKYSDSCTIDLVIPNEPVFYRNSPQTDFVPWYEFSSYPDSDYESDQGRSKIIEKLNQEDNIIEQINRQLNTIAKRKRFRLQAGKNENISEVNNETTQSLLQELFHEEESESDSKIIKNKPERFRKKFRTVNDILDAHYSIETTPNFMYDSKDIIHLNSRQQFRIVGAILPQTTAELNEKLTTFSTYDFEITPVLNDDGREFKHHEQIEASFLGKCFAYRTNNQTFTAPSEPGLYFILLHVIEDKEFQEKYSLIEIEIIGHKCEV